ncbi:MAG: carbon starvation protein A [Bryobacterales bacterium]|nr:carbon starvation protein A [Bryobacterales bacterium]MDE0296450.1 carbon starvation protein A [Bryobacterales bacterium]MDE0433378.1 carbon starvation protein A [Bryobacterales bacterium]
MEPVFAAAGCFLLYFVVYRFYARHLGARIFQLDPTKSTPAHDMNDGVDYVPCRRAILFGHHYASIAGLAPMLGPAIAVIWGWLPGMLWVVLGTLFIGAVHDFGALVVSMRHKGLSVGKVAEDLIGRRAKSIFLLIILFLICLVMGVFVRTIAGLFTAAFYPESVFPTFFLMGVAMIIGWRVYKHSAHIGKATAIGFALMMISIWVGLQIARPDLTADSWILILLGYALAASILPVWLLLQPRDYLNSLLLYLGLGTAYLGFFLLMPDFSAPAVSANPEGAPPIFPFVFIVIACGAVSGFHGLVSSGTTSKQIDKETDAVFVGYGGMVGESLLGLLAVLACTAGFRSIEAWSAHYSSWDAASGLSEKMRAFIEGAALFITKLGLPMDLAQAFIALVAVSFALTSLDSGTRLLRYNIGEIANSIGIPQLGGRYVASIIAVALIGFFAFYQIDGQPAGLALWGLFGSTNQVLGALTLLTISIYLRQRGRNYWYTAVPMAFMMVMTVTAMLLDLKKYTSGGQVLLTFVALSIFLLSLWLVVEAILRFRKDTVTLGSTMAEGD